MASICELLLYARRVCIYSPTATVLGEFEYWSEHPVAPNPTQIINTVPYRLHRRSPPLYQSRAVEVIVNSGNTTELDH